MALLFTLIDFILSKLYLICEFDHISFLFKTIQRLPTVFQMMAVFIMTYKLATSHDLFNLLSYHFSSPTIVTSSMVLETGDLFLLQDHCTSCTSAWNAFLKISIYTSFKILLKNVAIRPSLAILLKNCSSPRTMHSPSLLNFFP